MYSVKPRLALPVLVAILSILITQPAMSASAGGSYYSKHTFGLFLGATRDAVGETESSFGLEYEYRVSSGFGWGVLYEATPDGHHEAGVDVVMALANWHPSNSWRLALGVGQETVGAYENHTTHVVYPEKSESVVRLGAAYDIHFSNGWGLAPTVNIDFVDGETVEVFGLVLAKGF